MGDYCADCGAPISHQTTWRARKLGTVPLCRYCAFDGSRNPRWRGNLKVELSEEAKQVLIGVLLGDGYICPSKNGVTAYLRLDHAIAGDTYLRWKAVILAALEPRFGYHLQRGHQMVYMTTRHWKVLGGYRKEWYPQGKKALPAGIEQQIEPLGLAVWFMDDGGRRPSGGKIATHGFTRYETERLRDMLANRWGIVPRVDKYGERAYLRFNQAAFARFAHLIEPHIHPDMRYKLGAF